MKKKLLVAILLAVTLIMPNKVFATVSGCEYEDRYELTRATLNANGRFISYTCDVCGGSVQSKKFNWNFTIYKPNKFELSQENFYYDGTEKKPSVKIYDINGGLITPNFYSVSYMSSKSKDVGVYGVVVTFNGAYTGTKIIPYRILPRPLKIKKLVGFKKGLDVYFNGKISEADGYEVRISTNKKYNKYYSYNISNIAQPGKRIKNLKKNTKYYVAVRSYKKANSQVLYSGWTKSKVKTK